MMQMTHDFLSRFRFPPRYTLSDIAVALQSTKVTTMKKGGGVDWDQTYFMLNFGSNNMMWSAAQVLAALVEHKLPDGCIAGVLNVKGMGVFGDEVTRQVDLYRQPLLPLIGGEAVRPPAPTPAAENRYFRVVL